MKERGTTSSRAEVGVVFTHDVMNKLGEDSRDWSSVDKAWARHQLRKAFRKPLRERLFRKAQQP